MTIREARTLIIGAGTAGLAAAIEFAVRDESVLVVDTTGRVGGSLHISWAQMSAAGTSLQSARGIEDSPDEHFDDVMRISGGTADPVLVRRAVEEAPHTLEWLLGWEFDVDPGCPALHYFHEPYSTPRTYWGLRAGRSVLDALERAREVAWGPSQELALGTRLVGLQRDGQRITSVTLRDPRGVVNEVAPEVVILATGGYAANPGLFAELTNGHEVISPAAPTSDGSGIVAGSAIGAAIRGSEFFLPTFGGIEDFDRPGRSVPLDDFPQLTPQERQPWEVFVDVEGQRFIAEDGPSVDRKEHALLGLPGEQFWIVYDERVRADAPPLFPAWSQQRLEASFSGPDLSFVRRESLHELAMAMGIDSDGLHRTISNYNDVVAGKRADLFAREHCPVPIETGPFYAIRSRAVALKSPAGLAVDAQLRVVDTSGHSIENLYAIGEALGGGTLSGRSFVGGMSVTPALSFGRQLGRSL